MIKKIKKVDIENKDTDVMLKTMFSYFFADKKYSFFDFIS